MAERGAGAHRTTIGRRSAARRFGDWGGGDERAASGGCLSVLARCRGEDGSWACCNCPRGRSARCTQRPPRELRNSRNAGRTGVYRDWWGCWCWGRRGTAARRQHRAAHEPRHEWRRRGGFPCPRAEHGIPGGYCRRALREDLRVGGNLAGECVTVMPGCRRHSVGRALFLQFSLRCVFTVPSRVLSPLHSIPGFPYASAPRHALAPFPWFQAPPIRHSVSHDGQFHKTQRLPMTVQSIYPFRSSIMYNP